MIKILIAEDDLASRKYLYQLLSVYGTCDLVVDGLEAIDAFLMSQKEENPYDLICLDVMMPKVDGVRALKAIRDLETQKGLTQENQTKIIMTTVLAESNFVQKAFEYGCNAYASKPIDSVKFQEVLDKLGFTVDEL